MPDLSKDVRPITYLKNHAAEAIRQVTEEGRCLLITQNGESKAVLMDVASYELLRQQVALLALGDQSRREVAAGKGRLQTEVFRRGRDLISQVEEARREERGG